MSYPPPRPKKTPEEAHQARVQALEPYQFAPGRSGNPAGFPRARREQLEACERAAREHSAEAIETRLC